MPWIEAKRNGECAECGHEIEAGDRALYDPLEGRMYCETCGWDVEDPED
jgi:hypothetical protein